MTMVSAVDAAVAVSSPAACRRMFERKEDMCSAVGGAAMAGIGSVPTAMPMQVVEAAVAVAPAAVRTVASREEGAARVGAADAVGIMVTSAASEGMLGKWGVKLPPVLVSWRGAAVGGGPAPLGDAPAEERGRPSETEAICTLRTRVGRPSETEAMGSPGARIGATP